MFASHKYRKYLISHHSDCSNMAKGNFPLTFHESKQNRLKRVTITVMDSWHRLISIFIIQQQQSHVSLVTGCRDYNNQGI